MPFEHDFMLHTRNCKFLHDYLNQDKFDIVLLEGMLKDYFGHEFFESTKQDLEKYFNQEITNLRQYFTLLDAKVAEMYQTEHPELRKYQR